MSDIFPKGFAAAQNRQVNLPILETGQRAIENSVTPVPEDLNLVSVYRQAKPGVVKIVGVRDALDSQGRPAIETVTGSGFFVTEDGRIATDYHVIQGLKGIEIQTADGRRFAAKVEDVSRDVDKANDLALLKVNAPGERFMALPLGDPNFKRNDSVLAIGYPRGWQDMYISPGTYNGTQSLNRVVSPKSLGDGEDGHRTVLDATIHVEPGNSGGPLLSKDGRVVGIIATTDAKPNQTDDTKSVPGSTAESTPVAVLLNLLNRSQRLVITNPFATAGTLNIDRPPPFYQQGVRQPGRLPFYPNDSFNPLPAIVSPGDIYDNIPPTPPPGSLYNNYVPGRLPVTARPYYPVEPNAGGGYFTWSRNSYRDLTAVRTLTADLIRPYYLDAASSWAHTLADIPEYMERRGSYGRR